MPSKNLKQILNKKHISDKYELIGLQINLIGHYDFNQKRKTKRIKRAREAYKSHTHKDMDNLIFELDNDLAYYRAGKQDLETPEMMSKLDKLTEMMN